MKIRTRLTLQFTAIVALLMMVTSLTIYFTSAAFRKYDFYDRLERKANNTATLLIDVNEISSDLILRLEKNNPTSLPYEKISVYDINNKLLYSTDYKNEIRTNTGLFDKIRMKKKIEYLQDDYEVVGFLFTGKQDKFVVITAAKDIQGFKKLRNLRSILLMVFAVSILLIAAAGWLFAGRALAPISVVVNQVEKITESRLDLRVAEGKNKDEISQLAHTFNLMLSRIESAFKIQKNFIANASHELRTPLTSITGQLEVLLLKPNTEAEYRATIESVLEDMRNLNNISNRLLLLAQTSSENFHQQDKPLRVDELLWEARADLLRLKPEYSIDISISEKIEDDTQLTIDGNDYLLKIVFVNLMDNGCKYSDDKKVEVKISEENNKVTIQFADKGIGISAGDLQYIFEPFYRGQNATVKKGHGIGLSLVHRIVTLQNGKVSVDSALNKGSVFTLSFLTSTRLNQKS